MIKNSVVILPEELPNVVFSSQMTTQVYVLKNEEIFGDDTIPLCEDTNNFESSRSDDTYQTVYSTSGEACPFEGKSFKTTLEFNEHSESTIVTRVDY